MATYDLASMLIYDAGWKASETPYAGRIIGSGGRVSAYGPVAAGVSAIYSTHSNTHFLGKSFRVTEAAHMFVIIGGSILIHSALGAEKSGAAAVTFEYVLSVFSFEGMINAQFTLALIQSECFQCFYEHDIL